MSNDVLHWHPTYTVTKYTPDQVAWLTERLGHEPNHQELIELREMGVITPDEEFTREGNLLLDAGLARITDLIIGTAAGAFTSTGGFMGVGNQSTAATGADTTLGVSGSAAFQRVASAPVRATTTTTNDAFQGAVTFGSSDANFAWNEWGMGAVSSGSASATTVSTIGAVGTGGTLFNRKVDSLGTKGSGSSWTLTAKITLN